MVALFTNQIKIKLILIFKNNDLWFLIFVNGISNNIYMGFHRNN